MNMKYLILHEFYHLFLSKDKNLPQGTYYYFLKRLLVILIIRKIIFIILLQIFCLLYYLMDEKFYIFPNIRIIKVNYL